MKEEIKMVSFLDIHMIHNHQVVEQLEDAKIKLKLVLYIKKQFDKYLLSITYNVR